MKILCLALVLALVSAPAGAASATPMPLFDGLGSHTLKIASKSPEAQKYFDQGLRFYFGFNHGAAIRSFEEARASIPSARWRTGA